MQNARLVFFEQLRAALYLPLLKNSLRCCDVYMPQHIAKVKPEHLHLPGYAHGIRQPILDVWASCHDWLCHGFDQQREISCSI
jgi:hypothetical protein